MTPKPEAETQTAPPAASAYHNVRSVNDPRDFPELQLEKRHVLIVGLGLGFDTLRSRLQEADPNSDPLLLASHNAGAIETGFPDNAVYASIAHHMNKDEYYLLDSNGERKTTKDDGTVQALSPWNLAGAQQYGVVLAQNIHQNKWGGLYLDELYGEYPNHLIDQLGYTNFKRQMKAAWNRWRDVLIDEIKERIGENLIVSQYAKVIGNTGPTSYVDERLDGITTEFKSDDPTRDALSRITFSAMYGRGKDLNIAWYVDDAAWEIIAMGGDVRG